MNEEELKAKQEAEGANASDDNQSDTAADKKEDEIDYDQELQNEIQKFEKADHNREGYLKRKVQTVESEEQEAPAEQQDVKAQVQAALREFLPLIKETVAPSTVDAEIAKYTSSPGEAALIKFHLENTVSGTGSLAERVENARLIANKKKILKNQKELQVALANRSQMGNTVEGTSGASESAKPAGSTYLSSDQVSALKAKGWSQTKIDRFIQNLKKSK